MDSCLSCKEPVTNPQHLKCNGFCRRLIHLNCTALTGTNQKLINSNPNILWVCDDCAGIIKSSNLFDVFNSLKEAVKNFESTHKAAMDEVSKAINANNSRLQQISSRLTVNNAPSPLQRPTINLKRSKPDNIPLKPSLSCGTKSVSSVQSSIITIPPPKKRFWIFISRLATSVTENDVSELAKTCLGKNYEFEVKKLVKKDASLDQLNFISFKLGMDEHLREIALKPDTWPSGILYREFIDEPRSIHQGFLKSPRVE